MRSFKLVILFLLFINQTLLCQKFIHAVWYNVMYLNLEDEENSKKQIDIHIQKLADLKINTLIFLTKDPKGYVYYKSKYAPSKCEWDVLEYIIKKCKEYNIEIHPYINVFEDEYLVRIHPEYAELRQNNKKTKWVSPALKEVTIRMFNIIKEIVENYEIDGIQLDRVRYQGYKDIGFHPESVRQFKKLYKKSPSLTDPDFYQFKCDLISNFVKDAYNLVKSINKDIKFSAAVFHTPTTSRNNMICQQWDLWVKNDILDFVFPMAYTDKPDIFFKYLKEDIEVIKNTNVKLIMGVGIYYEGMNKEKLNSQIKMCLESPHVAGICYFNAYSIFDNIEFQEVIKKIDLLRN